MEQFFDQFFGGGQNNEGMPAPRNLQRPSEFKWKGGFGRII